MRPCRCRVVHDFRQSARRLQQAKLDVVDCSATSSLYVSGLEGKRCQTPPCACCAAIGVTCCRRHLGPGSQWSAQPPQPQHAAALSY